MIQNDGMKKILFVDDEQNVLDGLKRMLRSQRESWVMQFASSGREALEILESGEFDVIVTDMKMPGMDGASLLGEVCRLYPRVVRFFLSGQADMEAAMRSVSVSHQFLLKPCDPDELKAVVERACQLEQLLNDCTIRDLVGGVDTLPVLPRTYQALTSALSEGVSDVDVDQICAIIEQDSGLVAQILHLVNSSFFAVQREVSSLRQAAAYLGLNTIRDLVLSFEIFSEFEGSSTAEILSLEKEQDHAVLTARIARGLIDTKVQSEQAFLAAMIHDIGKLVLTRHCPDRMRKILALQDENGCQCSDAERECLGVDHAATGAYLLGLWGLPYPVIEAVAHHHDPASVEGQKQFGVLAAVHLADALAHATEAKQPCEPLYDEAYIESLGVSDRIPGWIDLAAEEACKIENDT